MKKDCTKISIEYNGSKSAIVVEPEGKPMSELKVNFRGVTRRSAKLVALTLAAPFCTKVYINSDGDEGFIQLLARLHSNSVKSLPSYDKLKSIYSRLKPLLINLEVHSSDKKAYFNKGKVCFYE
jgi:hypothetical protein